MVRSERKKVLQETGNIFAVLPPFTARTLSVISQVNTSALQPTLEQILCLCVQKLSSQKLMWKAPT